MTWKVEWDDRARRELRGLDQTVQQRILGYLRNRIATSEDPCRFGRGLSGDKAGLWPYRVGLSVDLPHSEEVVLVLRAAHRREVYR